MKPFTKDKEDIKQMVLRVLNEKDQWTKHVAHNCCKCQKCTCGKHKCKLSPPKLDVKTGKTTYNQSFTGKKSNANLHNQPKLNCQTYHPKQFINKSQYRQQYYRKNAKNQAAKPIKKSDNISFGGPNFAQTSYQSNFTPKVAQKTSMIKNPQNLGNSGLRMNSCSHYRETFHGGKSRVQKPIRQRDNLKTQHAPFTGTSSYNHDYNGTKPYKKNSNIDNFAPHRQYKSSHGLRTKSSYRQDFTQKRIIRCPAQTCC